MVVNKKKMLLAGIGGVVAGVAVTFITALGSLSENLILQEISSFVIEMMLPFFIWLILTPNTNKGYDWAGFTCAYRPGLRKLIKPFVWAYWGSCISALCVVVLKHLPIGKLYFVGICLMLVFLLIHAVIYAVYKFGYIRFTKGKKAVLLQILYVGVVIAVSIGFIWWAVQPVANGTMFRNRVERNIDKSYNVILGLGSFLIVLSVILLFMIGMRQLIAEKEKSWLKRQEEDSCIFLARVADVGVTGMRIKDVFMLVNGQWFPFCCPTSTTGEIVELVTGDGKKRSVRVGKFITFEAKAEVTEHDFELETSLNLISDIRKLPDQTELVEHAIPAASDFANLWYEAEKAVCRTCRYATVCMDRKLPCITFATKNGRWDRTVLYKRYPEYMEAASEKGLDRLEGVGVVRWYDKDAAMAVGFEEACAVIVCVPAVSILSAGSMLCSVNGEDINSPKILSHILDMHRTAGDTFEVTVRLPKKEPVTKTITVPESDEGFAGYVLERVPYSADKQLIESQAENPLSDASHQSHLEIH